MSKILAVDANDIHYKKDHRLLKCPKCSKWNKTPYKRVVDKIFVVTCKKCGTRYSPSLGAGLSPGNDLMGIVASMHASEDVSPTCTRDGKF